jgi:polyhydroxyalkanoate synthesis regulator phasin
MVTTYLAKQLEGIVDEMIENGDDPKDIIDRCKDAVIESMKARNKPVPEKVSKLDIYRG